MTELSYLDFQFSDFGYIVYTSMTKNENANNFLKKIEMIDHKSDSEQHYQFSTIKIPYDEKYSIEYLNEMLLTTSVFTQNIIVQANSVVKTHNYPKNNNSS